MPKPRAYKFDEDREACIQEIAGFFRLTMCAQYTITHPQWFVQKTPWAISLRVFGAHVMRDRAAVHM